MTQVPTSGSKWSPHTIRGGGASAPAGPDRSSQVISILHISWGFDTLASRFPSGGDNVLLLTCGSNPQFLIAGRRSEVSFDYSCCCLNLLACSSVLIVDEPTQTWYLSDALKGWLFFLVVDRVFFISIFLIFWWNLVNLLVNHQNLEKVCKYLCNIWESV